MGSNSIKRDHHLWTRDTIKNVTGDVTLDIAGDITLDADGGEIYLKDGGTTFGEFSTDGDYTTLKLYEDGGASADDFFRIRVQAEGVTTLSTVDANAAVAHLNIEADGHVEFDGCGVGFDLVTPTYDATNTDVDFRTGNKQFLTFDGGDIVNVRFIFPATSGNFVCLIKQDGTGGREITNYKVYNSVPNPATGSFPMLFAGGSNPDLTDDANHVDIISIFWDGDNEIAYAVPSLDFQF